MTHLDALPLALLGFVGLGESVELPLGFLTTTTRGMSGSSTLVPFCARAVVSQPTGGARPYSGETAHLGCGRLGGRDSLEERAEIFLLGQFERVSRVVGGVQERQQRHRALSPPWSPTRQGGSPLLRGSTAHS